MAKISTLAVGSQAAAALRGEIEPKFCPMSKTLGQIRCSMQKKRTNHKDRFSFLHMGYEKDIFCVLH